MTKIRRFPLKQDDVDSDFSSREDDGNALDFITILSNELEHAVVVYPHPTMLRFLTM